MNPLSLAIAVLSLLLSSTGAFAKEYPFSVQIIDLKGGSGLVAVNDGPSVVRATVQLLQPVNFGSDMNWPLQIELPPYSSKALGVAYPLYKSEDWDFSLEVSKTILSTPSGDKNPTHSTTPSNDYRLSAKAELQKMLEPVAGLPRWFSTEKVVFSFVKDGLPFLLAAYLILLTILLDIRAVIAMINREWLPALGQGGLAIGSAALIWLQHLSVPDMYLGRFIKYVEREPTAFIPCLLALGITWVTAQWLVPTSVRNQYSRF